MKKKRSVMSRATATTVLMSMVLLLLAITTTTVEAFSPSPVFISSATTAAPSRRSSPSSSLYAIGVLAKKAKQADLRKYVESGVEDEVMAVYKQMKANIDNVDLNNQTPGPLQEALTKRKGTITVIPEFKRNTPDGKIHDFFDPELLSPQFREYGASAIAVMCDERMGGCTYDDLKAFVEEQRRAKNEVPGPCPVINNDLIVDELQIAQTKAYGAISCVITYNVVQEEELGTLLKSALAVDLEPIVAVSSHEEAQKAVNAGARIILVNGIDGVDDKVAVVSNLQIPAGDNEQQQVCTIANILVKNDNQLQEIEEAWAIRDKGFNCAWVGEALYKAGMDATEQPGSIIKSMKSKSSLKWASPKAYTGRGEGAKEYLGDIMM